ncbi:hypothetical protein NHX12_031873 [Muraenolepis orangiensis]|uniref:Uncharacterized protein n=1 Tax=Muraenolepis orangiensis TaxID=630683 RepID=A0A9Q0E5A1_9TELE|nr:hypothetical protein NHX12_031873 [Muraenolepis orangiensis]
MIDWCGRKELPTPPPDGRWGARLEDKTKGRDRLAVQEEVWRDPRQERKTSPSPPSSPGQESRCEEDEGADRHQDTNGAALFLSSTGSEIGRKDRDADRRRR